MNYTSCTVTHLVTAFIRFEKRPGTLRRKKSSPNLLDLSIVLEVTLRECVFQCKEQARRSTDKEKLLLREQKFPPLSGEREEVKILLAERLPWSLMTAVIGLSNKVRVEPYLLKGFSSFRLNSKFILKTSIILSDLVNKQNSSIPLPYPLPPQHKSFCVTASKAKLSLQIAANKDNLKLDAMKYYYRTAEGALRQSRKIDAILQWKWNFK
ncbi:hypothetical protein TNIN_21141 [Trichonephila inaurata madagascariensis]|uniref:Uncharacterized protein n=1 Tax=Trichonephila inaurata madagascariensis TaxID=2747483 RepID=A0A8X6YE91_9ARAC|nr:hypothetical protein TNIN_21141 [Trichonephila inaurata madagascariensis]